MLDNVREPENDKLPVPELVAVTEAVLVPLRVTVEVSDCEYEDDAVYVAELVEDAVTVEVAVSEIVDDDDGAAEGHTKITLVLLGVDLSVVSPYPS